MTLIKILMVKNFPVHIALGMALGIICRIPIMFTGYIAQPMVYSFLDKSQNLTQTITVDGDTVNTTGSDQMYRILKYINFWWEPAFVIVIIVYSFMLAQREDWRGEYYG